MATKHVAILLAVWEPREDWLIELLDSLNRQTYPSLSLYVRDDASPTYPIERLRAVLEEHITAFPFVLNQNKVNVGSNQTFAELVRDCEGDYIAFCDQDDVWLEDKIANTVRLLEQSPLSPTMAFANVSVMDGDGHEIAPRMEEHRKRHVFMRGKGLAPTLIYRNFVMGCTVVMTRERAASYLPFPSEAVHDHYLAFRAALDGAIDYLDEPQMRYRVYGGNQTGVLAGVKNRDDYFARRIKLFDARIKRFCTYTELEELQRAAMWSDARIAYFNKEKGAAKRLWRLRGVDKKTTLFERVVLRLPAPLFRLAVRLVQKGLL